MSWPYPQFEPQIIYRPKSSSWQCLIRELPGKAPFRSIEGPNPPAHLTPNDALAAAEERVKELLSSRQEALSTEVVKFLTDDKPRLRRVMIPNPDKGPPIKQWEAQRTDGTWTDPQPSPYGAVKLALER
jgi:hypothetical protein